MDTEQTYTSEEIADIVQGRLQGSKDYPIRGIDAIDSADRDQITMIGNAQYASEWMDSSAGAALVTEGVEVEQNDDRPLIYVKNLELASVKILEKFAPEPVRPNEGVHATAVVDESAQLGKNVSVGACCVIGANVEIGDGTILHPNVTIMDNSKIGAGCELFPGVVVRERCEIGNHCLIHSNVNIGADGFGYRPSEDGKSLVKIPHIGTVIIHDHVELGAGTCVDRGKFAATTIGEGTKIDNMCQIAHNCRLGRCIVVAAHTSIGGSVTIGDGTMIGGNTAIKEQLKIGAGVMIAGHAGLMKDVEAGEKISGSPARDFKTWFKEIAAVSKLPDLIKEVRKIKSELEKQENSSD